jgi:pimeloyl-ACP methyl ester carboxylesterase
MRNLNGLVQGRPRYAEVAVPVTLVYSEQDWSHPAERDQVASLLADVQRITLPDIGHFSALERPADMVRILRSTAGIEVMSTPTTTSTQGAPS